METSVKEETDDEAPVPMETEEIIKAEDAPSSAEQTPPDAEKPDETASGEDQAVEPAGVKSESPEETAPPEEARSSADAGDAEEEGTKLEEEDGGQPSTDPTGRFKRPTPSSLREWEHFETVDDDVAQIRLARAMGYPPSW